MKRLVIDGNSVYEIDLDCVRQRRLPEGCEISRHLQDFHVREGNRKVDGRESKETKR